MAPALLPYPPAQRTGEPVPVAERTCAMDGIHSATEGIWNGIPVTLADMKAMASNFKKYSTGSEPYYRPFINLNHDDALGSGLIVGARFDGRELTLDGDHIPEQVGAWANGKQLHGASIEFWEPKFDAAGNCIGTFVMPDGQFSPTPVIKCLSLLGNDAPGMKGMSSLPVAKFSDSNKRPMPGVCSFSVEGQTVDRDALIAQLAAAGFDQTKLTDLDTLLQYLVDCGAKPGTAAPSPGDPAEGLNNPVPMADLAATGGGAGGGLSIPSIGGPAGQPAPTSLTLKFNDASGKPVTATVPYPQELIVATRQANAALGVIRQHGAALATQLAAQAKALAGQQIAAFSDRMAAANVPPVTIAAYAKTLAMLDNSSVRKFSDGKTQGTALAEAMRDIEAATVPAKKPGEKIEQPVGAAKDGTTGSGGGDNKTPFEDRKKSMLANDPLFGAAIRKREKLAAAGAK